MGVSEPLAFQVSCTIDSAAGARELAAALVEERLAACVQVIGPVHSTYRWEGAVQTATEWLLLMKTSRERFAALRDAVVRRHPYDVPEVVAMPIEDGLPGYVSWIGDSVS